MIFNQLSFFHIIWYFNLSDVNHQCEPMIFNQLSFFHIIWYFIFLFLFLKFSLFSGISYSCSYFLKFSLFSGISFYCSYFLNFSSIPGISSNSCLKACFFDFLLDLVSWIYMHSLRVQIIFILLLAAFILLCIYLHLLHVPIILLLTLGTAMFPSNLLPLLRIPILVQI